MKALAGSRFTFALVAALPSATAATTSFNFTCITNNGALCSAPGVPAAGFALQVSDTVPGPGFADFTFQNISSSGAITQIYFDTNNGPTVRLASIISVTSSIGASFAIDGSPGFPPGGTAINWGNNGTTDFEVSATSQGGVSNNGVNIGEFVTVRFGLNPGVSYAALISSFGNPSLGASRMGVRIQSLPGGTSESLYATPSTTVVPLPAALPLMLGGLLGLGLLGRRRAA